MGARFQLLEEKEHTQASLKQIRGLVKQRNKLYSACKDVLQKFNEFEEHLMPVLSEEDNNYIDFIRNTLENAVKKLD